jgi:hypothetical protein
MVSKTKQGNALRAAFREFSEAMRGIPGVKAAIATDDPVPAIVTFIDDFDDEVLGDIGEAEGDLLRAHTDITPEFRTIFLGSDSLSKYAIADDDLIYLRDVHGH